jgi:hypothetical protein
MLPNANQEETEISDITTGSQKKWNDIPAAFVTEELILGVQSFC